MESSPSSKKKIVFSITGLSITCLILLVLWLYLKEKSNLTPFRDQNDISLEPYLEIKPGFHPDSVLKFGYHTKSFHQEYSRSSRDQDWTPAVYPQRVQKILNLLTQIHFKKLPPMKKPLVTLTVEFSNQQSWKAGWDGTHLQWLTGSYSGFGSQLNAADRILMLGGSLSFFPREYNWCPTRPTAFEFLSKKGSSLSLLHIQGEWLRSPSGLNQGKRDRSFGLKIENWLGLYCDLEIEQAIDIDYLTLFRMSPRLNIELSDKQKLEVDQDANYPHIFLMRGKQKKLLFQSSEFLYAYKNLLKIAHSPTKKEEGE